MKAKKRMFDVLPNTISESFTDIPNNVVDLNRQPLPKYNEALAQEKWMEQYGKPLMEKARISSEMEKNLKYLDTENAKLGVNPSSFDESLKSFNPDDILLGGKKAGSLGQKLLSDAEKRIFLDSLLKGMGRAARGLATYTAGEVLLPEDAGHSMYLDKEMNDLEDLPNSEKKIEALRKLYEKGIKNGK